jgi:pimeloyl-ACP methyl ester carboxylesterase
MIRSGRSRLKTAIGLVHGFGFPNQFLHLHHWGRIPDALAGLGFSTVEFETDVYGSIYSNSGLLSAQIRHYLEMEAVDRLLLFCHSRGAIEACLAASDSRLKGKIEAIVGFGAPIFGSYLARHVHRVFRKRTDFLYSFLNVVGSIMGDKKPDSFRTIQDLGREWIKEVQELKSTNGVRFILVLAHMDYSELPLVFRLMKRLCGNDRHPGDGIADFPSGITLSSIETISLASMEASKMTHWGLTGLPAALRASFSDPREVYMIVGKKFLSERFEVNG